MCPKIRCGGWKKFWLGTKQGLNKTQVPQTSISSSCPYVLHRANKLKWLSGPCARRRWCCKKSRATRTKPVPGRGAREQQDMQGDDVTRHILADRTPLECWTGQQRRSRGHRSHGGSVTAARRADLPAPGTPTHRPRCSCMLGRPPPPTTRRPVHPAPRTQAGRQAGCPQHSG